MSKVLVDRALLERMIQLDSLGLCAQQEYAALRAILAQPAEAEGFGKWSDLKRLAEKATPGPWWVDSHGHRVSTEDGMQTVFITADKMGPAARHPETGNLSHWPNDWDASYIVNASPDKILELIAALSAVTAERDRLRELSADQGEAVTVLGNHARRIEAERDQLRAEAERYVPLHEAVQRAAGELPEGWAIQLYIERNGGGVELIGPDGTEDFATNNERLDCTVIDALEAAMAAKEV